nr:integrase, catalytic region, zinc finger, CCHC-type, peptidase aspartic, catalytic [Tanacetum cinerariifolium]
MQKNLALIAKYLKKIYKPTNNNLRTSSNSRNKNVDTTSWENVGSPVVQQSGIHCFNYKESGHFAKECRKPKRVKDSAYHKKKMLMCKQAEQGVPLQAEQYDWLADTDEEIDEQELEACYSYMAKIQENDQNDVESDDERAALANSKLDVDENKKIQKQLKKANTTLTHELKECKTILAQTSKTLEESNSVRDSCLVALQNKQTEFEKYKAFNDRTIAYDKKRKLNEILRQLAQKDIEIKEDQFRAPTAQDMEILIQTCLMPLAIKTQNDSFIFLHELKQEMHADLKYVESLEKEIDKLESDKAEFSNIELKKLIEKCKGKFVETKFDKPSVLRQPNAQRIPKPLVLGVNHKTNVSRPQHKSNQLKDKVVPNNSQIVQLILFIFDSECTKHMTGNLKLLCNFVEKFLGTVRFGNDQFAQILRYGDLVHGNVMINRIYYVKGLNHNLFSVGQFCDADLEDETPEVLKEFLMMIQRNLQAPVIIIRTDRGTEFLNKTLNAFFKEEGIEHQTSTARTPEQNGVVERRNHTLVEAARTMLSASKLPYSFGLKQLQPHAILKTDPSLSRLMTKWHITSL